MRVVESLILLSIIAVIAILYLSIKEEKETPTFEPVIMIPYCDRMVTVRDGTREVQQLPCEE